VDIQISKYLALLEREKEIKIDLSDSAKDFLANIGWDPVFGARPLKRAIQKYLLDELAMEILDGKVND